MALTNFGALHDPQLMIWSRRFWKEARNRSFVMPFVGDSADSMIQRVTELTETKSGNVCVMTLLLDAQGDGIVGDNQAKGNEEALGLDQNQIRFDQLRFAHANSGRMSDQKTIVNFRTNAKDQIGNRHAQVMDEVAFLTLSGVSYAYKTDGTARVGSQLSQLEYAADVTAPTAGRHLRWHATNGLLAANTAAITPTDKPSWKMLVETKAYAVNSFLKPIRTENNIEVYNVFMTPDGIAKLKQDADFLAAWKDARERGESNPLFKGSPHGGRRGIFVDGLNILEYRNVYHPSNWGSGGDVKGQRVLFCGAQALGFADPLGLGAPGWDEEKDDYGNRFGIAGRKVYGFKKPRYFNTHTQTVEDFGVLCLDTAR